MKRYWLLAAALLVLAPLAGHAESDPFWDGALIREGSAAAPPARQNPSRRRQSRSDLIPTRAEHRSRVRAVPAPASGRIRNVASNRAASEVRWDLAAAGAAFAGIGLILLASAEPPAPKPAWIWRPEDDEPRERGPTLTEKGETRRIPNDYVSPAPSPEANYAQPWWAITAAEQDAIDRWNESPEKELGIESLERWLDANVAALPRVDAQLLKRKLSRDA